MFKVLPVKSSNNKKVESPLLFAAAAELPYCIKMRTLPKLGSVFTFTQITVEAVFIPLSIQ